MFNASTVAEIEAAFDGIAERRPDALLVGTDPFYIAQRAAIVARAGQNCRSPPFSHSAVCGGGWPNELRHEHPEFLSPSGYLCWKNSQRC